MNETAMENFIIRTAIHLQAHIELSLWRRSLRRRRLLLSLHRFDCNHHQFLLSNGFCGPDPRREHSKHRQTRAAFTASARRYFNSSLSIDFTYNFVGALRFVLLYLDLPPSPAQRFRCRLLRFCFAQPSLSAGVPTIPFDIHNSFLFFTECVLLSLEPPPPASPGRSILLILCDFAISVWTGV